MGKLVLVVSAILMVLGGPVQSAQPLMRVTLLGTGSPIPQPDRFGPATLVQAGGQNLLFDAGRGVTTRLYQIHVPLRDVSPLFITHYHSDHINGLPDLWLTGWLGGPWAKRTTPMHVIGPTGLKDLTTNLEKAYKADILIRAADEHYPLEGVAFLSDEFAHDGVVFERDGVRVTAFEVDHGDKIKPAYGYRVDFQNHSVTISGDTRPNENVVKYGAGTDLLVHEVCAGRLELANDAQAQTVMAHHTSPKEAGIVFSRAKPKLAAFTHIVIISRPNVPPLSINELAAQTRETYQGPLEVGEDLMSFDIDNDQVQVHASNR